jgi:futalosine hydrolase
MRILLVAATASEIGPLAARLGCGATSRRSWQCAYRAQDITIVVTGVGMVATAAWCARALAQQRYDLAINLGLCGSFDPSLPPESVVHVVEDHLPELGAEDGDAFLSIHDLRLLDRDAFPWTDGRLRNVQPPAFAALRELTPVSGITVNTVHGAAASIAAVVTRVQPQVESMEGAAFMYCCLTDGVPFAQVRAVSNVVERRNRAAWRLDEAIARLTDVGQRLLDHA